MEDENVTFAFVIADQDGHDTVELPLERHPAIAAQIGIFLSTFGAIEVGTSNLLAALTGMSQLEAKGTLAGIRTFDARLDHVERTAENSSIPIDKRNRILDLLREMRWLNGERNNYAHAQYAIGNDTGKFFRGSWLTDKKPDQWDVVTPDFVNDHILRARKILTETWQLHVLSA